MEKFYKLRNEKSWKSLLQKEDALLFTNMAYKSAEDFNEKYAEKGLLKKRLELPVSSITELRHAEKPNAFVSLIHNNNNKRERLELNFENATERDSFVSDMALSRKFIVGTGTQNRWRAIAGPLLGLVLTAIFTFAVYEDAWVMEEGGSIDTSGRRSLYKMAFKWLAEMLGSQATLIIGGALGLWCLYLIVKRLKTPPVEVVWN